VNDGILNSYKEILDRIELIYNLTQASGVSVHKFNTLRIMADLILVSMKNATTIEDFNEKKKEKLNRYIYELSKITGK